MITDINYTDDPISGAAEDALGREPIATQLASALRAARALKSSSVFSLVGGWGSGKSSVINLLTEQLRSSAAAVRWEVTEFNPWAYNDDAALQAGFYQELLQLLKPHLDRKPVKEAIAKLRAASTGLRGVAPLLSMAGGPLDAGKLMEMFADALEASGSLSRQMKEASDALARANVPILFILDDVDRLAPAELVMVTKLVRLTGRLPHVHYLLCFDEQTILDVLSRTDLVPDDDPARAQDYLEKIIQLRFDVPPLRRAQTERLIGEALQRFETQQSLTLSDQQRARLTDAVTMHLVDRLRTPRGIRRLFTQLPHSIEALGTEVDIVEFMIITWLRLEEPVLYAWVEQRRDWILGLEAERHASDERAPLSHSAQLNGELDRLRVPAEHRDGLMRLLGSLFPMLRADWAGQPRPTPSTDTTDRPRIRNADYFGRYFAFDVPEEDLADQTLQDALTALSNSAQHSDALDELTRTMRRDPELVIRKLTDFLTPSTGIVTWFMSWIPKMSEVDTGLLTQRAQLTNLVARMLARLAPWERELLIDSHDASPALLRAQTEVGEYFVGPDRQVAEKLGIAVGSVLQATDGIVDATAAQARQYVEANVPASPDATSEDFWAILRSWSKLDPEATKRWVTDRLDIGWDIVATIAGLLDSKLTSYGHRVILSDERRLIERYVDEDALQPRLDELLAMQTASMFQEFAPDDSTRMREARHLLGEYARTQRFNRGT